MPGGTYDDGDGNEIEYDDYHFIIAQDASHNIIDLPDILEDLIIILYNEAIVIDPDATRFVVENV